MGKMDGKICLVGGNLGKIKKDKFKIGLGGVIAKNLLDAGAAAVFLVDLDFAVTQACASELGGNAKAADYDIMKDRTFDLKENDKGKTDVIWTDNPALSLVESIVKEHGKLDVLVTNFDKFVQAKVDKTDDAVYNDLRDQNIWPTFHLLAAVRQQMSAQCKANGTYAKVVMITNMVGKAGMAMGSMYAAFKASLIGLNKGLAREFGRFANVNTVAYGPFAAKKMQGPKDRIKAAYMVTKTDMANQDITFEKVAPMVAFLASDDAIAITGQTISVDGGLWLKLEQ
jgi:3-oxoacyl-[acyl-carrier protein] reductase